VVLAVPHSDGLLLSQHYLLVCLFKKRFKKHFTSLLYKAEKCTYLVIITSILKVETIIFGGSRISFGNSSHLKKKA
jgi:hypothetical protein